MFKEKPFNVVLFCGVVILCTAVLQYLMPNFSFFDGGLIIVILLTLFLDKDQYTIITGIVSMVLVQLTIFYDHDEIVHNQIVMQHIFSAIIMLLTTVAVLFVKKLYRSMEADQDQMNALFMHATEGIVLSDSEGKIVLANPACLDLFGYEKEEVVGKPIEIFIPMRFHHHHDTYRKQFNHSPSNRKMGQNRDLFARKKDGTEFQVEISLSHYKQKNQAFVIAFIIDITSRKEAELRMLEQRAQLEKVSTEIRKLNTDLETKVQERTLILQEALQELEQSQQDLSEALSKEKELNEIKSRFVSMASHEFRTPLSSVLSSASLIGRYTKEEEQNNRDRHINRIKDSVKHLNDLLEDFLSLGKLEEGKVAAQPETFHLKEFIEDVVDELKAIVKGQQQLEIECEGAGMVNTDKKLLKNILINLLTNAVKFSNDNGVILLTAHQDKDYLELSVKDEGIGISEEDQQHLFSSFFRGRNVVNIQGTGLGLHIVKRYVDLLEGQIKLKSTLGKGTKVTLQIPL